MYVRRLYEVRLEINSRKVDTVIIDPHYEVKHSFTVNDEIILSLLCDLDGGEFEPEAIDENGFEYYCTEKHYFGGRPYKLIWLLPQAGNYIGIINCYRRKYEKEKL